MWWPSCLMLLWLCGHTLSAWLCKQMDANSLGEALAFGSFMQPSTFCQIWESASFCRTKAQQNPECLVSESNENILHSWIFQGNGALWYWLSPHCITSVCSEHRAKDILIPKITTFHVIIHFLSLAGSYGGCSCFEVVAHVFVLPFYHHGMLFISLPGFSGHWSEGEVLHSEIARSKSRLITY